MDAPKVKFLTDRWLDDSHYPSQTVPESEFVQFAQAWADKNASSEAMSNATENYFCVRHPDGRYGFMLEIELDDGSTATPDGVEKVRADVLAGEFSYHAPGTEETWNERAVYRVFFAKDDIDAEKIEAAAKAIFDHIL